MNLKPITLFLIFFLLLTGGFMPNVKGQDTSIREPHTVIQKRDSSRKKVGDTIHNAPINSAQVTKKDSPKITGRISKDTSNLPTEKLPNSPPSDPKPTVSASTTGSLGLSSSLIDSSEMTPMHSPPSSDSLLANTNKTTDKVLAANKMINTRSKGTYFLQEIRIPSGKEFNFYLLCIIIFILAIFKTFYSMYFNNLFRIFFNTSLRQIQLTDQLSQAKLPSFLLNIFFTISGGTYIWLLFTQFNKIQSVKSHTLLLICILCVAGIYLVKFIILKFIGWLVGIQQTVDNYIFVIFLVNKITGVLLIPFLVLLSFFRQEWIPSVAVISALFLGLLFLSRYAKSYGALEKKLSVNSLHLLIFVVGAEVIPIFIFYKIAVDYFI